MSRSGGAAEFSLEILPLIKNLAGEISLTLDVLMIHSRCTTVMEIGLECDDADIWDGKHDSRKGQEGVCAKL
jgi:hypothetical protein